MSKGKFANKVKKTFNRKLSKVLQPLITKQMFVGYKLLKEKFDISIEEYLYSYNSTLQELENGYLSEDYNSFYNDVLRLEI